MTLRLFFLVLAVSLSCRPLEDASLSGDHVVVTADPSLQLCSGSLVFMDEFLWRLSDEFSLSPPVGSDRIHLHWLDTHNFDTQAGCLPGVLGCANPREIFSRAAPLNHELVHSTALRIGKPPPFFEEGLAVAFEGLGEAPESADDVTSGDIIEVLTASNAELVKGHFYPLAGGFTSFLISRHGIDSFLRFYAALEADATLGDIDRTLREVLDTTIDEAVADFEEKFLYCRRDSYDAKLLECNAPELAWDGLNLEKSRTLSCEDADAVGPFSAGSVVVHYTISITDGGLHQLRADGDYEDVRFGSTSTVSMHICDIPCQPMRLVAKAGEAPEFGRLDAGRYSIRLHSRSDGVALIGFQLTRVDQQTRAMEN